MRPALYAAAAIHYRLAADSIPSPRPAMWINRAVKWLLPRDEHFFDLLERGAGCARACGASLVTCCGEPTAEGRAAIVATMHGIEHEADAIIAEVCEALN